MRTSSRARKIIINADDFGMSTEANRAIVEAFEKNVISSTTLMANMSGFNEACELAHCHRLLGKIGVHLNLTSGYPLSEPIRKCSRFCEESGMFRSRQTRFRLSKEERLAVETEIEAQSQSLSGSRVVSNAPGFTSSCPHGVGYWSFGHHCCASVRDKGYPAVTQLRSRDRPCSQVLQMGIQHQAKEVWPGEDSTFWLCCRRAGNSRDRIGRC